MNKKIIMCEEVLKDGTPLPLGPILKQSKIATDTPELKQIWANTMQLIKQAITAHIPGVKVEMPKLWEVDEAKEKAMEHLAGFRVSLNAYDTTGAFPLQVSRHFAPGGSHYLGVAKRPGSADLTEQISRLRDYASNQPLIVGEDDMFTGGTAEEVITMLQESGFKILAFIAGLQVSARHIINGVPIIAIQRFGKDEVLDIVDPRDVLFGLPDGGLVIEDGAYLYRAPWVLPWVDLTARASVPPNSALLFSRDIAIINSQFFTQLEQVIKSPIRVGDMSPEFRAFIAHNTPLKIALPITEFCEYAKVKAESKTL